MQALAPPLPNSIAPLPTPIAHVAPQDSFAEQRVSAYDALFDVAPHLTPALDFTVRVAELGLSSEQISQLIDEALIDIVFVQEAHPDIAAHILDHVATALQQRRPFETVHEVCARALSETSLRDLRRSIARQRVRSTPGEVHVWRTHIAHWLGGLRMLLEQARWAGSGHAVRDATTLAQPRFDLANSRAIRVRRDAMTTSARDTSPPAASSPPPTSPDRTIGKVSPALAFEQSVRSFVETVRNRTDSHEAALGRLHPLLNLKTIIESQLQGMLAGGTIGNQQPPSLDNVRLYAFDTFGFARNPGQYDLDHVERRRPHPGVPILDAAMQIVSGRLPITTAHTSATLEYSPAAYGVYHGQLQSDHTYHANDQVPGLSITQLLEAIDAWRWLGDGSALPDTGRRLLASLDAPQRALARADLRLSYQAGDITAEAAVLGELVLTQPDAARRMASGGEYRRVTAYTLHAGSDNATVAGIFAVSEYPDDGTTLLYLAGDLQPWREYESPDALRAALRTLSQADLSEAVLARLPVRMEAVTAAATTPLRLVPTPNDPLRLAGEASLATLRDDMRFDVEKAIAPARSARYAAWLAGASPNLRYRALQSRARANTHPAPGKHRPDPVVLLPENIADSIEAMLDVRMRLSLALPDERRLARELVQDTMVDIGAGPLNPDHIRLEIRASAPSAPNAPNAPSNTSMPVVSMSLVDATLGKIDGTLPKLEPGQVMALTRIDDSSSRDAMQTEPLPDATALMERVSVPTFRDRLQTDLAGFTRSSASAVRHDIRTTFILDAIAGGADGNLDDDLVALARAVADGAQWGDGLAPPARTPRHFDREWLCIDGYDSTTMLITDRASQKLLMFAPLGKGTSVRGFAHRDDLQRWLGEQAGESTTRMEIVAMFRPGIHATINEFLIEHAPRPASSEGTSPAHALLDAAGAPVVGDTFEAVGRRLTDYAVSTMPSDASFDPDAARESIFQLALSLRYFDLAFGAATWASPLFKPLSFSISVADAGLGTVMLLGDGNWRREGLKSIATAIGTQGLAASKFTVLGRVPGGERFRYFTDGAMDGEDGVIEGLYFASGRFVAKIDEFTFANVVFDAEAGEFRLVNTDTGALGPHIKLGRKGVWRCVPKPEPGDPTSLTDPHVLYDIENAYGERLQEVNNDIDHAQRQVFRNAKQEAMFRADAARGRGPTTPSAFHKLRFIAPEVTDHAALGSIAGEIESAMDAEASLERIGNIVNEAPSLGAVVTTVPAIAGIESREIEGGLVRAMAVAIRDSQEGTLLARHAEYAMAPASSATRTYLTALRQLGTSEAAGDTIELGGDTALSHGIDSLRSALDGKATTPITYQLNTPRHTMLFGRRVSEMGNPEYFFFDPAVASIVHTDKQVLLELVTRHLKFMRPTYGSFEIPGSPAVVLRRIKVNELAQSPVSYRSVKDLSRPPLLSR
ncbi:dermonecrotic toxin domain-containing protein [Pandoraea pneumonica]|uniref:dermonecrotic toxin domain-containing protein n=1 Tax=Pandoraea pneumonica TaxID=2508299 RepID=UPI003CF5864D